MKKVYRPGVLPVGTLRYPKISAPDTKGQYADGKYKTEVVLDDEDLKAIKKILQDAAKELLPDVKAPHLPIRTDKKDGTQSIMLKSQKKPLVIDSKKNKLPEGTQIRGGTRARIAYTLTQWEKGISLWLECVQVVELAEGFNIDKMSEIDGGYEAPACGDTSPAEGVEPTEGGDKFNL